MNTDALLKYSQEQNIPIDIDFLQRIQQTLNVKKNFSTISADLNTYTFYLTDCIRESIENILLKFTISESVFKKIEVEIYSEHTTINKYDLKNWTIELINKIFSGYLRKEIKKYVIRNYFEYYNSFFIRGEIYLTLAYRTKIFSLFEVDRREPMSQNILCIDTEVSAIDFDQARTISYNHAKNIVAQLSMLLDVGFGDIRSKYDIYVKNNGEKIVTERYRTGFIDYELGLIVKDNMNGLKCLSDQNDIDSFHSGKILMNFVVDREDISNSNTIVSDVTSKESLEKIFLNHKIQKSNSKIAEYRDDIEPFMHFPNNRIQIPRCIRKYFSNVIRFDDTLKEKMLSSFRLYNLSAIMARTVPTASVAYRVACIECIASSLNLNFSQIIRSYCDCEYDESLIDYYYSIRSAHFHAGKFAFTEYSTSFMQEFDSNFLEKRNEYFEFIKVSRNTITNWINKVIIDV